MTVYVDSEFLLALAGDDDWFQDSAEAALAEYDVETSALSYLELLLAGDRYEFDAVPLVSNLLELVPVGNDAERRAVLRAASYYEEGMEPMDAFHAAVAGGRGLAVLTDESDYEGIDVPRATPVSSDGE